jgi:hypothetical protein
VQELGAPEGWTYGPPSYGFGEPSPLPDPSEIV